MKRFVFASATSWSGCHPILRRNGSPTTPFSSSFRPGSVWLFLYPHSVGLSRRSSPVTGGHNIACKAGGRNGTRWLGPLRAKNEERTASGRRWHLRTETRGSKAACNICDQQRRGFHDLSLHHTSNGQAAAHIRHVYNPRLSILETSMKT